MVTHSRHKKLDSANHYDPYISREQKNRTIVAILWWCLAMVTIVEILHYIIYQYIGYTFTLENFFLNYIAIPLCISATLAIIITFLYHGLNKKHPHLTSYIVMIGYLLFIHGVVIVHYGISVIYITYCIPIFISIVFIDKFLTTITAVVSLTLYIPLYLFYLPLKPDYTYKHDYMDFSVTIVITIICYVASLFIMKSFKMLMTKVADVTQVKTHLEKKVQLDSFTQLYNRASFNEILETSFQRNHNENLIFTTIILDVDNFKRVNDTYGHHFGDEVIQALVAVINKSKRESDKAFRYGGEEFTLILETDSQGGFLVAEKIRTIFQTIRIKGMENESFSVSAGVCECQNSFVSVEEYFKHTDAALYKAKHSGKNKTIIAQ